MEEVFQLLATELDRCSCHDGMDVVHYGQWLVVLKTLKHTHRLERENYTHIQYICTEGISVWLPPMNMRYELYLKSLRMDSHEIS